MEKKHVGLVNIIILIITLLFTALSAVLIFVGEFDLMFPIFGACILGLVLGIIMVVKYFTSESYKNSNEYGFSLGVLIIILSICGMIKAKTIASSIIIILGLFLLLAGVVVMQYAMDLYKVKDLLSSVVLLFSILMVAESVMVLLQPFSEKIAYDEISWWMVFITGALSLLIDIYTMIKVKLFNKKDNSAKTDKKDEADKSKDKEDSEIEVVEGEIVEPATKSDEAEVKENSDEAEAKAISDADAAYAALYGKSVD